MSQAANNICSVCLTRTGLRSGYGSVYRVHAGGMTQTPYVRTKLWNPPIEIIREVADLRLHRKRLDSSGRLLGLVPTMGALHEGHLSLARMAAKENAAVYVSIYVNPTQFGVNEDLGSYPRTFEADVQKLKELNEELTASNVFGRVMAVFAPTTATMYPTLPPTSRIDGYGSFVTITPIGNLLEGASRPVFFRGVATVCMKLFNIVKPDNVYFGQKDVQQSVLIKQLVKDFHLDTQVRVLPTQREEDGLAMSSRNVYLGSRRRNIATVLHKALQFAEQAYLVHHRLDRKSILCPARAHWKRRLRAQHNLSPHERVSFEFDYISLADPDTMEEVETVNQEKGAVLSAAMTMLPVEDPVDGEDVGERQGGSRPVRLIDNIILPPYSQLAVHNSVNTKLS